MEQGYFGKEWTHECKFHKNSQPQDLSVPNTTHSSFMVLKIQVHMPMHSAYYLHHMSK